MRKSLVWRLRWMGTLVLLCGTGIAWGQLAPPSLQSSTSWGGPLQPDIGGSDNRSQPSAPTVTASDSSVETSAQLSAQTPADSSANIANSTISEPAIKQLGTPFPLQLQPQGLKIGPLYLTSLSDSFFYATNSSPGQPTQSLAGNTATANLVYSRPLSHGILAIQGVSQFSLSGLQPFFNQSIVAAFNEQLSERWSFTATAQFTYFQNSILANPQSLLSYTNAGVVQQTAFVQQHGYNLYETNNFSLSYQLSGRTQITFTPVVNATFQDLQTGWSNVRQFGGTVAVTRALNSNLTMSIFYGISHSSTSGAASTSSLPSWVSQSFGVAFQGKLLQGPTWSLAGSIATSSQSYAGSFTLTPTGNLTFLKSFRGGASSIAAAYSRSEAASILVSSGYFDQADISYNQRINRNVQANVGVGEFRTSNTGFYEHGLRAGGGITYQWTPRVSLHANYNFAHQNGNQSTVYNGNPNFYNGNPNFYYGNTNYLSFGLTWRLGAQSGL